MVHGEITVSSPSSLRSLPSSYLSGVSGTISNRLTAGFVEVYEVPRSEIQTSVTTRVVYW